MEAMAKLGEAADGEAERNYVRAVADGAGPASPFALWRLTQAGDMDSVSRLARLLDSQDAVTRLRTIYVLAQLRRNSQPPERPWQPRSLGSRKTRRCGPRSARP